FPEHRKRLQKMMKGEARDDYSEARVRVRQALHVTLFPRHVRERLLLRKRTRTLEHGGRNIATRCGPYRLREAATNEASSACYVQDSVVRPRLADLDQQTQGFLVGDGLGG